MKHPEILAPAGGREQLEAAVKCGADAVYFGASGFNARRNASNFPDEEFISAVAYCHARGVKAYITLNTLIKDTETEQLEKTVHLIASGGADAIIVQDLGVADIIRSNYPFLPLHASTQMAVHDLAGAKLLERYGFKRIVLARELSISEIKKISGGICAETEVFVHGAHCMSASGMCYMSSALGARSGNRGLCAQPCRLNFKSRGREYALSLKDMCLADRLSELEDAGVTSFKIEGRMKRPEYVAAAVTAYRTAAEGGRPDTDTLRSVFSRSGFTDGYAAGKRNVTMFGYRTKDDVVSAQSVLPELAALYKDEYKRVPLKMKFRAAENRPASLTVTDGEHTVTVGGAVPEKAIKLSLTEELAARNLLKLGGTFYYSDGLECEIDGGILLPASALNAMRREALEKLTEIRGTPAAPLFSSSGDMVIPMLPRRRKKPELRLRFAEVENIPDGVECDMLILPVDKITDSVIEKYGDILCAELPALIYPADEEAVTRRLSALVDAGVKKALCQNIGAVAIAENAGAEPLGGALLNILNSKAGTVLSSFGVKDITVSPEMSFDLMRRFAPGTEWGYIAYGHLPLMHFRCCPMQGENGCGGCPGKGKLTDRRGDDFTVICENRRYSVLYNPVPLYTGDMKVPYSDFVTLYFTDETAEQSAEITAYYKEGRSLPCRRTAGLYDKNLL